MKKGTENSIFNQHITKNADLWEYFCEFDGNIARKDIIANEFEQQFEFFKKQKYVVFKKGFWYLNPSSEISCAMCNLYHYLIMQELEKEDKILKIDCRIKTEKSWNST